MNTAGDRISDRTPRGKLLGKVLTVLVLAAVMIPSAGWGQEIHGFIEGLNGVRLTEGGGFDEGSYTARETRFQLRLNDYGDTGEYFARLDYFFDSFDDRGGDLEIREAYFTYTGFGAVDFKIGRQITTWGTGDLLFINDVFPKDWQSFFIGREDQYLKAPMDVFRAGVYSGLFDINVIAMPRFEPDRLPTPDRLTFYNPMNMPIIPVEPENNLDKGEIAIRLSRQISGWEAALYGYRGYFRQPVGFNTTSQQTFYPRLNVYGASLRRGLLGGVFNLEGGYYDSRDDQDGDNPFVENSTLRGMAGFDRQLMTDLQLGLQGYFEQMQNHDLYAGGIQPGAYEKEELRQLYTMRLTRWLKYQTIMLSLFTFYSPTDEDFYVRANASYKLSDPMEVSLGANLFGGEYEQTLFGQFEDNDNVYLRLRYSF
ncbi:MAG: hypothetical protein KJ970_14290 [Candidatus Eisenbacteria bacterium]|uniref:DUF1302 domain-containing protein n=1 Tax=Eiseniibacteriota bacterium TaxID=2212470 RepID=A0A948RY35_UNCEI|nr:hypothetical protein [Candidatus Eisenbacteria bacterium]MBU1948392.1 hypothetical protein [Candidatus Eisenbacteria bacterium]MBU2692086.1 hypothetical protein [Candidatus Eisenbacteria bacterium]